MKCTKGITLTYLIYSGNTLHYINKKKETNLSYSNKLLGPDIKKNIEISNTH